MEEQGEKKKKTMEMNLLPIRGTKNQTAMADVKVSNEKQKLKGSDIVIPNPKPNKGYASKVVDLIEKLIVKWMYNCSQPHHYLGGNFAPVVDETPSTTNLITIGHLPITFSLSLSLYLFLSLSIESKQEMREWKESAASEGQNEREDRPD